MLLKIIISSIISFIISFEVSAIELKQLNNFAKDITSSVSSKARTLPEKDKQKEEIRKRKLRVSKYNWTYVNKEHSFKESAKLISWVYAATWPIYYATQPDIVKNKGSFTNYKNNFGDLVFDKDEPLWNWIVHPLSGSQLFLFYRANGYSRISALSMSIISSTLFEFTVEIYTEPASIQDLYQTPILGAVFGVCLEEMSLYFLNTGNMAGRVIGHILNPATLLWFYKGKIRLLPNIDHKGNYGLNLNMDF